MIGVPPESASGDSGDFWITHPHHDGSPLYVSEAAPRLGDGVTVWLRVPTAAVGGTDVDAVHVRVTPDAEARFVPAVVDVDRSTTTETWWRATLVCHNPVTTYRWILTGGPTAYAWVNGMGLHLRDVPDSGDFRLVAYEPAAPDWPLDSVVYQVFPDRFARSAAADPRPLPNWARPARWDDPVDLPSPTAVGRQLYGGDLDGITEHLDHLVDLGVDVLYLTPFFPARSNHRYDATSFDAVDPLLGGDEALRRLTAAAHGHGIRVLGDFTTNHTGAGHAWFRAALADPDAPERAFYFIEDDGRYAAWLGIRSLPKLNHASPELRRRMFHDEQGVVRKWLGPDGGLDGWRVDVANMTGRYGGQDLNHEVAREMRVASVAARADALVVGEHTHDYTTDLPGDGWHGVMNYAGFTRPVWTWLTRPEAPPEFLGQPVRVPRLGGDLVAETMRDFSSRVAWSVLARSFTLVGSHDTSRVRSLVGDDRLVVVAAGLLFTMPGIPMLTYGDEIGLTGRSGEDGRRPMPWDAAGRDPALWDESLRTAYRRLIGVRRDSVALRRGGMRWLYAGRDVLVFLREAPGETALVHVARDAHAPIDLDLRLLPGSEQALARFGGAARQVAGALRLEASEPTVSIHTWVPTGGG